MGEYERSITINASLEQIEDFVTDVKNLPKYLPSTRNAMPEPGERVRVQGDAHGHHYDSDGYFHVDKQAHRMEWGSDGEELYQGWLEFHSMGENAPTQVVVHLTFEPLPEVRDNLVASTGNQDKTINQGLEHALLSMKNILEGHGGKVEGRQI